MGKLILIFAAGLLAGVLATKCEAADFGGNELACKNFSQVAFDVPQLREAGVEKGMYFSWLETQLAGAMGNPDSYIQSQKDADFVMSMFKRIWDDASSTPESAETLAYADCMKAKVGMRMLKGGRGKLPKGKKA